jgi:hypothetical protein
LTFKLPGKETFISMASPPHVATFER